MESIANCKAYCLSVVESLSRNRGQMGDLFIFASWVLENAPMYNYATHRSVAAGTPLQVVAGGR